MCVLVQLALRPQLTERLKMDTNVQLVITALRVLINLYNALLVLMQNTKELLLFRDVYLAK